MRKVVVVPDYPPVSPLLLWGFCSYILIWFLQAGIRSSALGAIRIEFLVAVALALAILVIRPGEGTAERSSLPWFVVALLFCMVIQLPFSQASAVSQMVFRDRVVKFAFMAIFISNFVQSPRGMRYLLGAFLASCSYITLESFRGALNGTMVWMNQGIMRLHGDTPMFRHPNSLAGLAIGGLPFVYFLLPVARPKLLRLPLVGLGLSSLGCLMYSGSRTAYVALMFFILFLWSVSKRKVWFVVAAAVIIGTVAPMLPTDYKRRFQTIFTGKEIEGGSTDSRKETLRDAVAIFKKYPLGIGISAFPTVRSRIFDRKQDTHNLYLEVATNLGVQGLAVFLVFVLKMLLTFRGAYKSYDAQVARLEAVAAPEGPPGDRFRAHLDDLRLLRAVSMAGAGYILLRMALGLFGMDLYEIYWWIGTGLALSLFNIDQHARRLTDLLGAEAAAAAPPPPEPKPGARRPAVPHRSSTPRKGAAPGAPRRRLP